MRNDRKTKTQLASELAELQWRIKELEAAESQHRQRLEDILGGIELYRLLVESMNVGLWVQDENGSLIYVNDKLCEMWGYGRDELIGQSVAVVLDEANRDAYSEHVGMLRDGLCRPYEIAFIRSDGQKIHAIVSHRPIGPLEEGRFRGSFATVMDTTEQKWVAEVLQKSEEKYRDFVENINDVIYGLDENGVFTYVSPVISALIGYSQLEAINQPLVYFVLDEDKQLFTDTLRSIFSGQIITTAFRVRTKSDEVRWVRSSNRPIFMGEQVIGVKGVMADITDRKRAEEALRTSEGKLLSLVENIPDTIMVVNRDGKVLFINRSQPATDVSREAETVFDHITTEYQDRFRRALDRAFSGGETGLIDHGAEGSRWWSTRLAPLREEADIVAAMIIATDVTDRKAAEEEKTRLEAQVQHAQKLESLGILTGGIAHDFNNLLMGILGNVDLALMKIADDSSARHYVKQIETTAKRAAELTNQMLAYSGKGTFVLTVVNLNKLVEEMTHLLEVSILKKVRLIYNFASDLPPIRADVTQIRQVVMNLITNASESIGDASGVITLSTGVVDVDREYLAGAYLAEELSEGSYVYFEVVDTGCGMDDETLPQIFDPFFTTKFAGRGLGLAAVMGIVRGHGGAIKVTSNPRNGACFRILFPLCEQPEEEIPEEPEIPPSWRGSGTILVVDDEEDVREVVGAMLETCGYDVLTAGDGYEGVELFREHSGEIRAVLLDWMMPRMNGDEALSEILRIRSDARVLLSSGYSEKEATSRFTRSHPAGFIQKPYQIKTLFGKLREVLQE